MKLLPDSPATGGHAEPSVDLGISAVVEHVAQYGSADIGSMDEPAAVDLLRSSEKAKRVLDGQSTLAAARLSELGGLSAEDVLAGSGHSSAVARRIGRRGELVDVLPAVVKSFVAGAIPTENVDRIASVRHRLRHKPEWQARFDAKQSSLVRKASRLNPKAFGAYLSGLERSLSDDGQTDSRIEKSLNRVKTWTDSEGRFRLSGNFDAISGEQISTALQAEARSLAKQADDVGEPVHHGPQLDSQALAVLIEAANGSKGRPAINLIVDTDTLVAGVHPGSVARTQNGQNVPVTLIEQLLCDATITFTYLDRLGRPLAVGRKSRTVTDAQKAALRVMYDSCAVCDVEFSRCEIHHIHHWENGGPTDLDNLIPLCAVHHTRVHHDHWELTLTRDRALLWTRPDGTIHAEIPLPSAYPARIRDERRKHQKRRP